MSSPVEPTSLSIFLLRTFRFSSAGRDSLSLIGSSMWHIPLSNGGPSDTIVFSFLDVLISRRALDNYFSLKGESFIQADADNKAEICISKVLQVVHDAHCYQVASWY
mmetsp:Transcript_38317/g.44658  ORF Transcript_38317/g.44658 Transcript_38317/m.44658 type:complete len:107 (+) Transcript_38317:3091-3411(+)